ncbi:hypothetical protein [Mesorhizobium sp. NZP2298]|uniref:hypothetical protein n=1 Tax=Mesorhizobium sp. NZP2298 TaxID=2483403 RepID=UPI001552A37B|nr:hypothetical protein [Mesorhizobium sp. NZP2298]
MATIKNLGRAIVREPEPAGAKIERKGLNGSDEEQTSRTPSRQALYLKQTPAGRTLSLPYESMRGRWPAKHLVRPTDRENNHAAQTRAK